MSSSKKLICKGTLRQVFICLRPRTSYTTHCIRVYSILSLVTQGSGEGGNRRTREKVRVATVHKVGRKYQHD
jgi:hypothetical protein